MIEVEVLSHFLVYGYDKFWPLIFILQLTEYKQMEDQLRKTLNDLEKREKKLVVNEQEVCFFLHIYTERIIQVQSFPIQSLYP